MSWNDVVNAKGGWPRFGYSEWLRKGWGKIPDGAPVNMKAEKDAGGNIPGLNVRSALC